MGVATRLLLQGSSRFFFENDIQDKFEIVSLSGTSGGALGASLVWYAMKKGENPVETRLMDFWRENTAQTYQEKLFNDFSIKALELTSRGLLPQFNVSPASPVAQWWTAFATLGLRPNFTNFRELLEAHIDFEEIATWGVQTEPPILLLGASNILTGKLWLF